ncbi:MAG: cytochrome c biogenesis protein ResB [Verrucomicrobiae bacterium]|nr:cytochrome c biogenesis protein ResB [Verrucomicrobiae bacterium]
MKISVFLTGTLVFLLLAGAVLPGDEVALELFHSPLFLGVVVLFGGALVACMGRNFRRWSAGFFLAHGGVVLILAGAGMGFVWGKKSELEVPVSEDRVIRRFPVGGGGTVDAGFGLAVKSFQVERHPPDYALCRPDPKREGGDKAGGYELAGKVRLKNGVLNLGPLGRVPENELKDPGGKGEWVGECILDNGWVLRRLPAMDRHYRAVLKLTDSNGETQERTLEVNRPLIHCGWRLYLMSYDNERQRHVALFARRDPGRGFVVAGIWALMAGVVLMALRKTGGEHGAC